MTEDQKYEIATLASEASRLAAILEQHMMTNTPIDPIAREKAYIAWEIARTEWLQARARLAAAQRRVAGT